MTSLQGKISENLQKYLSSGSLDSINTAISLLNKHTEAAFIGEDSEIGVITAYPILTDNPLPTLTLLTLIGNAFGVSQITTRAKNGNRPYSRLVGLPADTFRAEYLFRCAVYVINEELTSISNKTSHQELVMSLSLAINDATRYYDEKHRCESLISRLLKSTEFRRTLPSN